jgi:uncharacterized membrane protein
MEVFLSLIPAAFIFLALNTQRTSASTLSRIRQLLFATGLVISIFSWCVVVAAWMDPFPLKALGDGGFSDIYESLALDGAACTSLLTIVFAFFGQGLSRILLLTAGVFLFASYWIALLSNGV